MPLNVIQSVVIFPLSFGIGSNMARRDRIILDMADFRASCLALFYLVRGWPPQSKGSQYAMEMKALIHQLGTNGAIYLHTGDPSHLCIVYATLDEMTSLTEIVRKSDPSDWIKSVVTRAHQYIRYIQIDFERLRATADFRNPYVAYILMVIWLFLYPVFFAPHFAYVGRYSTTGTVWPGVYSSAIATVLMISLGFTLMDTDDPFDQTVLGSLDCQSILTAPTHYMWDTPQKTRKRVKEETHMDLVISEVGSQTPLNHSPVSPRRDHANKEC